MNSLFQQLNPNQSQSNSLPSNIRNMISAIKGISNPQAMLQNMMNQNPQLQSIMQASNGNYEQAFKSLAKQMNVNGDEIINMLK